MSNISWGEFLAVWIPFCIILDVVYIFLQKRNSTVKVSEAEERKNKTIQLNTPFKDNVTYDKVERKPLQMSKVEAVKPKEDILPPPSKIEGNPIREDQSTQMNDATKRLLKAAQKYKSSQS